MFLVSLGCLHTETSFLLVPDPPDLRTLLLAVGAGITPELGTGRGDISDIPPSESKQRLTKHAALGTYRLAERVSP